MMSMFCFRLRRSVALAALGVGVVASAGPAHACGQNSVIGSVCAFAGTFCPVGYVRAQGQALSISAYQPLFTILGNAFGSALAGEFRVPDMSARAAVGTIESKEGPALGAQIGTTTITVNLPSLPAHSHAIDLSVNRLSNGGMLSLPGYAPINTAPALFAPSLSPGATVYLNSAAAGSSSLPLKGLYTTQPPGFGLAATAPLFFPNMTLSISLSGYTAVAGGQQPLPIQSPALGVTYCIATVAGTYPPVPP